jgi:CxxC-x17-CxxC domain-containing protein
MWLSWRDAPQIASPSTVMTQPLHIDKATGKTAPICVDCGQLFERVPGEEAARRGTGMPLSQRCPECRDLRRAERNAAVLDNLRHGSLRGVQPAAAGPEDGGGRVYSAECAACRRPIRLPFKPRLDRPVFCRHCHDHRQGR